MDQKKLKNLLLMFFFVSYHPAIICSTTYKHLNFEIKAQSVLHTHSQTHGSKYLLPSFSDTHSRPVLQGHKTVLRRVLWQQVVIQAASWPSSARIERGPKYLRGKTGGFVVSRPVSAESIRLRINDQQL